MEVSATLTDLALVADARDGLGVIITLEGRNPFAFAGLTDANMVAIVSALSGGALCLSDQLPIQCRAQFHGGRLVALGHATDHRWAIFEDLPEPRVVQAAEDMVPG